MSFTPNSEQAQAINHQGGVLLSAGAGSGKTAVIIEHIVHLVRQKIDQLNYNDEEYLLRRQVRNFLSEIVIMTFTTLAAGEIEIRLRPRLQEEVSKDDEWSNLWRLVLLESDAFIITTIHGLCSRLIKQGLIPTPQGQGEILSELAFSHFIKKIFDEWIQIKLTGQIVPSEEILLILQEKEGVLNSLERIFSDALIREMWNENLKHRLEAFHDQEVYRDLYEELGIKEIFLAQKDLLVAKDYGKKWSDFLLFFGEQNWENRNSLEGICLLVDFFKQKSFKIPPTPRVGATSDEVRFVYMQLRDLNAFLKQHADDLLLFKQEKDRTVKKWAQLMYELTQYVEEHYALRGGLSFTDLEYYVAQALKQADIREKLATQYRYLIVDEFQDTSQVQFDIIKGVLNDDLEKLFAVGDVKQAIYGFRGGELGVFRTCTKSIGQHLSLGKNYRSTCEVVDFNNHFFKKVLASGMGFTGIDPHCVPFEKQEAGRSDFHSDPSVEALMLSTESIHKTLKKDHMDLSLSEVDFLEAQCFAQRIHEVRNSHPNDKIAILYKKLSPSLLLIDALKKHNLSFSAQVKIAYKNDPIFALFYQLIDYAFIQDSKKEKYLHYMLEHIVALVGVDFKLDASLLVTAFYEEINESGIYISFLRFLMKLHIQTSNYESNLLKISEICDLSKGDLEGLWNALQLLKEKKYSLVLQSGDTPDAISIMTTHASKGLQFDHVFLGGVYSNARGHSDSPLYGKLPGSMQWPMPGTYKKYKSPEYIYEKLITASKNFSESKRLLYVACTRAKKSLNFFKVDEDLFKISRKEKNSWAHAFNTFAPQVDTREVEIIHFHSYLSNRPPFSFFDSLGSYHFTEKMSLRLMPELSVTRFSMISSCERLFYLGNICDISNEELELLQMTATSFTETPALSSSQRGSRIHHLLSHYYKTNTIPPFSQAQDEKALKFAMDITTDLLQHDLIQSEFEIKFEFFGQMITGIPDLFTLDRKNKVLSIIDFKTGEQKLTMEQSYWTQLYCYALGLCLVYPECTQFRIELKLLYLDLEKVEKICINFNDAHAFISKEFHKCQGPFQTNRKHCHLCTYEKICQIK